MRRRFAWALVLLGCAPSLAQGVKKAPAVAQLIVHEIHRLAVVDRGGERQRLSCTCSSPTAVSGRTAPSSPGPPTTPHD